MGLALRRRRRLPVTHRSSLAATPRTPHPFLSAPRAEGRLPGNREQPREVTTRRELAERSAPLLVPALADGIAAPARENGSEVLPAPRLEQTIPNPDLSSRRAISKSAGQCTRIGAPLIR